jgi:flagellar biosynthesis/type III secretory pathway chaperone
MKSAELLTRLKAILSAERKAQLKKYSSLKKVLKSLRDEKRRLMEKLDRASDEQERQEIESRLAVISKQRKKGLKLARELKAERD